MYYYIFSQLERVCVEYTSNILSACRLSSVVFLLCLLFHNSKKYHSTCLPCNLPCLVFESINTLLTYTCHGMRQTGQQHSSSFFLDKHLHIRLSFGIQVVHSIIIYSTISKITVRPREIETGGTASGVTSNHDNEAHEAQTLFSIA